MESQTFNVAQVKRYLLPSEIAHTIFEDIYRGLQYFTSEKDKCDNFYLTEILDPSDQKSTSSQIYETKRAEINGILEQKTFQVIILEERTNKANIKPGRFVLSIESNEGGIIKFRTQYEIGGNRD